MSSSTNTADRRRPSKLKKPKKTDKAPSSQKEIHLQSYSAQSDKEKTLVPSKNVPDAFMRKSTIPKKRKAICEGHKLVGSKGNPQTKFLAMMTKKRNFEQRVLYVMIFAEKPVTMSYLVKATNASESQLSFLMLSLIDKAFVMKRNYGYNGSKSMYWTNYGSPSLFKAAALGAPTIEEVNKAILDENLAKDRLNQLHMATELLLSQPKNCQLDSLLNEYFGEVNCSKQAIASIQSHKLKLVDDLRKKSGKSVEQIQHELCPQKMKKRIKMSMQEWKCRKSICMDLVEKISDAMEKSIPAVIALLNIETDNR